MNKVSLILGILLVLAIGVAGYFWLQGQQTKQEFQNFIADSYGPDDDMVTSTPTIQDETANWKVYTDSDFDFSLKYPENWVAEKRNTTVVISPEPFPDVPLTHGFVGAFTISVTPGLKEFEEAQQRKPWIPIEGQGPINRIEETEFLGRQAIKIVQFKDSGIGDPKITAIYLVYKGSTITIGFPNEYEDTYDYNVYNQILSSFELK